MPRRSHRVAHAVWAAVCITVCLLLVFTGREGHPPAIILLPLVLAAWAVGHGFLWGAHRLAAAGRRASADDDRAWPLGLQAAVVCTAAATLVGVVQVGGTVLTRNWYPTSYAGVWAAMLLVCLVHAACLTALLLRRSWSRWLSAAIAFGWAALLGNQVAEHLLSGSSDSSGLLIAVALMASLLLFGWYLLSSGKVRSFLGN